MIYIAVIYTVSILYCLYHRPDTTGIRWKDIIIIDALIYLISPYLFMMAIIRRFV